MAQARTGKELEAEQRKRRHPAERWTSRWTGLLLLLMLPQSAFGYALLGPGMGHAWVVVAHVLLAPVVILVAALALAAARRIPHRARREGALIALAAAVLGLVALQALVGLGWRAGLLARGGDLATLHIGLGILTAFVIAVLHVIAILPSILLSARQEHLRLTAGQTGSRRGE